MTKTIELSDAAYYDLVEFLSMNKKSIEENLPALQDFWKNDPAGKMSRKEQEKQLLALDRLEQAAMKYARIIRELRNEDGL